MPIKNIHRHENKAKVESLKKRMSHHFVSGKKKRVENAKC